MVGEDDHAKLGDFGIARAPSDTVLTRTGLITGSPAYLAPEVASGEPATAASDVWSLGGTLLPRRWPAGRRTTSGTTCSAASTRSSTTTRPACPTTTRLAGLLAAMLVKDPIQRWPAAEVRDDLRRLARGERSEALATGRDGQAGRDGARRRAAPAAGRTSAPPPAPPPRPAAASPGHGTDAGAEPGRGHPRADGRAAGSPRLLALVLVAGLGTWLLWPREEEPSDAGQSGASPSASQDPTSDTPSESPTEPDREPAREPVHRTSRPPSPARPTPRAGPPRRCGPSSRTTSRSRPRTRSELRDADPRVPGGERRFRGLQRVLEHDRVGHPARHQGGSRTRSPRRTRSTTSRRRVGRPRSRGGCSSCSRATGSSSPARGSGGPHGAHRVTRLTARRSL